MDEKLNKLTFTNAALFGLLIAVGYYLLFYHPSDPKNRLDKLNREMTTIKGEVAQLNREIKEGLRVNQEIEGMKKKADKIYLQIPETLSIEQALSIISESARGVGLSIQSIAVEGAWKKLQTVAFVGINVSVLGSFNQMMLFLSELTRNRKAYSVTGLTVSSTSGGSAGNLAVTAKIQIYRKLAAEEIKPTARKAR